MNIIFWIEKVNNYQHTFYCYLFDPTWSTSMSHRSILTKLSVGKPTVKCKISFEMPTFPWYQLDIHLNILLCTDVLCRQTGGWLCLLVHSLYDWRQGKLGHVGRNGRRPAERLWSVVDPRQPRELDTAVGSESREIHRNRYHHKVNYLPGKSLVRFRYAYHLYIIITVRCLNSGRERRDGLRIRGWIYWQFKTQYVHS